MARRKEELIDAVRHGNSELVRALALTGADIDECGHDALQAAIERENPTMVETLISLGADIHEKTDSAIAKYMAQQVDPKILKLNFLETYIFNKLLRGKSDWTVSADSVSLIIIFVKNGLKLSEELITLMETILTPGAIEWTTSMIQQVRAAEGRLSLLEQEDSLEPSVYEPDFNI